MAKVISFIFEKEDIMKKGIYTIIPLILILSGCSGLVLKTKHIIETKENIDLEVNKSYDSCKWIEKVDGIEISQDMIGNGFIKVSDDLTIICNSVFVPEAIGENKVKYIIDDSDFTMTLIAKDKTPPSIIMDDVYEVQTGNDYFDIEKIAKISDNYDDLKDLKIRYDSDYKKDEEGEYRLSVEVTDKSGNTSKKEATIKVIPKEKEIIKVPVYIDGESNNSSKPSGSSSSSSGSSSSTGSSTGNQSEPEKTSESFLSGVRDISVPLGTSISDIVFKLSTGITSSSDVSINYANVNTTARGEYTVVYTNTEGIKKSCVVTIY